MSPDSAGFALMFQGLALTAPLTLLGTLLALAVPLALCLRSGCLPLSAPDRPHVEPYVCVFRDVHGRHQAWWLQPRGFVDLPTLSASGLLRRRYHIATGRFQSHVSWRGPLTSLQTGRNLRNPSLQGPMQRTPEQKSSVYDGNLPNRESRCLGTCGSSIFESAKPMQFIPMHAETAAQPRHAS